MDFDDRLSSLTQVHLSWIDRFKVLCTGHLCVRHVTYTEFEVGAFKVESRAWTPPWRIRKPPLGYGEPASPQEPVDDVPESP